MKKLKSIFLIIAITLFSSVNAQQKVEITVQETFLFQTSDGSSLR